MNFLGIPLRLRRRARDEVFLRPNKPGKTDLTLHGHKKFLHFLAFLHHQISCKAKYISIYLIT